MDAIVTIPPYAPFIEEVARHPIVSGLRLNTVMPIKGFNITQPTTEPLEDILRELQERANNKKIWVDLKCRQLRINAYAQPPFTEITLSHNIDLDLSEPVYAYFNDGKERAIISAVDGNKLIMLDGPRRPLGPGESVNIPHHSLHINGYHTPTDIAYIQAGKATGIEHYMLSFVEQATDKTTLLENIPTATITEKIESRRGLNYVRHKKEPTRLMAARGDLYVELRKPHDIINALQDIIQQDQTAIAASRIFSSLAQAYAPSAADIGDVDSLMRLGYTTFMFGDEICMHRDSIMSGLNLLQAMINNYERRKAA